MDQNALEKACELELAGIEPVAEYVAAAGRGYGRVKIWKIDDGYLVYWGNSGEEYAVVEKHVDIEDKEELADWLEWQDLEPLETIAQRANVRGAHAVPEAHEGDEGPFYILETRYWYGATETSRFVSNNRGEPLEFETIKEARAWIESADGEVYYLAHNECARPSYKVVSI